jgi:hypothetical protein
MKGTKLRPGAFHPHIRARKGKRGKEIERRTHLHVLVDVGERDKLLEGSAGGLADVHPRSL